MMNSINNINNIIIMQPKKISQNQKDIEDQQKREYNLTQQLKLMTINDQTFQQMQKEQKLTDSEIQRINQQTIYQNNNHHNAYYNQITFNNHCISQNPNFSQQYCNQQFYTNSTPYYNCQFYQPYYSPQYCYAQSYYNQQNQHNYPINQHEKTLQQQKYHEREEKPKYRGRCQKERRNNCKRENYKRIGKSKRSSSSSKNSSSKSYELSVSLHKSYDLSVSLHKKSYNCEDKMLSEFKEACISFIPQFRQTFNNFENNILKNDQKRRLFCYLWQSLSEQQKGNFLSILQKLFEEGYFNVGLMKILKVTIKKKFNYENIKKKIEQQMSVIQKRKDKNEMLYQKFPQPKQIQYLDRDKLLALNLKQTIFLIDGNNFLNTAKRYSKNFREPNQLRKVQCQIRLNWLISKSNINSFLFFDDRFSQQLYKIVNDEIEYSTFESEYNSANLQKPIYSRRNIDKFAKADERVIQKMLELHEQMLVNNKDKIIVLVSSDRILAQQCEQIHAIKQSGGKEFFKFLKKNFKICQSFNNDLLKKILKFLSD